MNFTLMPSLKHIAFVKITIALWNRRDIKDLAARFYTDDGLKTSEDDEKLRKWQVVEDKVIEKVPQLPLPEKLKREILDFITIMGLAMLEWNDFHGRRIGIGQSTEFCWTPLGIVDVKKTAEVLVKDENIDISMRYRLACKYWLEDDVKELWNSMPQSKKDFLYTECTKNRFPGRFETRIEVEDFWTYYLKGEISDFCDWVKYMDPRVESPYQFAFESAASCGSHKALIEYFFHKLTPSERDESMVKSAKYIARYYFNSTPQRVYSVPRINDVTHFTDTLCFLLSQMNEVQQAEVFESKPFSVLSFFLWWPWQPLFMEMVNRVRDFLSEQHYKVLLMRMLLKVKEGYKDYNYHKLFWEFWQQIPDCYKKSLINENWPFVSLLLKFGDQENVRSILRSVTVKEREEMFHHKGKKICEIMIYKNKLYLLEVFIEACVYSEDSLVKFQEDIKRFLGQSFGKYKYLWPKFRQFLDGASHKDNEKRSSERVD